MSIPSSIRELAVFLIENPFQVAKAKTIFATQRGPVGRKRIS